MANEFYDPNEERLRRLERLSRDYRDPEQEARDREWIRKQKEQDSVNRTGGI